MCVCTKDGKRVEKKQKESAGKGGVKCHAGNRRACEHRYRERQEEQLDGEFRFFKILQLKLLF